MKAVFDTNILIDYLRGVAAAADEIERFETKYISIITYIEVLVGLDDEAIIQQVKHFLNTFDVVMVNHKVADLSVAARKKYKFKVPDAIVFATAQSLDAMLVTRNTKDFPLSIPIVRMPYSVQYKK